MKKPIRKIRDELRKKPTNGETTYKHKGVVFANEDEFLKVVLADFRQSHPRKRKKPVVKKPNWKGANLVVGAQISEDYKRDRTDRIRGLSGRPFDGYWPQIATKFDEEVAKDYKTKREAVKAKGRRLLRESAAKQAVTLFEKEIAAAVKNAAKNLMRAIVFLGESCISETGAVLSEAPDLGVTSTSTTVAFRARD